MVRAPDEVLAPFGPIVLLRLIAFVWGYCIGFCRMLGGCRCVYVGRRPFCGYNVFEFMSSGGEVDSLLSSLFGFMVEVISLARHFSGLRRVRMVLARLIHFLLFVAPFFVFVLHPQFVCNFHFLQTGVDQSARFWGCALSSYTRSTVCGVCAMSDITSPVLLSAHVSFPLFFDS